MDCSEQFTIAITCTRARYQSAVPDPSLRGTLPHHGSKRTLCRGCVIQRYTVLNSGSQEPVVPWRCGLDRKPKPLPLHRKRSPYSMTYLFVGCRHFWCSRAGLSRLLWPRAGTCATTTLRRYQPVVGIECPIVAALTLWLPLAAPCACPRRLRPLCASRRARCGGVVVHMLIFTFTHTESATERYLS